MDARRRTFKRKFNIALEPFKAMLVVKKGSLSATEWLHEVHLLRECALNKPEQYLGTALPPAPVTAELVHMIFDEFLTDLLSTRVPKKLHS